MAVLKPLSGKAYWDLMERVAKRVESWPSWKTGIQSTREPPMNQSIFAVVRSVQEILMSLQGEDATLREVMRTTARVEDVAPHFRLLRYYASRLQPLLDEFEVEAFKEQLVEEKSDEADTAV